MADKIDGLRYSILASGSSGNAAYLETVSHRILIDAGLSGKQLERRMSSINRSLANVEAIFVTHEHADHSCGVGVLARRYGMRIYANQGTWVAMSKQLGKINPDQKCLLAPERVLDFGDLQIESFAVSHDAAEPQFYSIHHDNQSFVILTDTGYVSDRVVQIIKNADGYLIECNHDVEMLRMGPYSWSLKQRILGCEGHLSNEEGANVLINVLGCRTKQVFLGHRSQHNNVRSLAHLTVTTILENRDFGVNRDFSLRDADPDQPTPLFRL